MSSLFNTGLQILSTTGFIVKNVGHHVTIKSTGSRGIARNYFRKGGGCMFMCVFPCVCINIHVQIAFV